jgi:hypothetical protein
MIAEVQKMYEQLLSDLENLDELHQPDQYQPDQRLVLISEVMKPLKQKLIGYDFDSDADEIHFFKTVLPDIISLYIYYTEKSGLENSGLIGTRKSRADYITRLTKRMDDFSVQHGEFYDYCSLRKTNFDSYYFLRNSPLNREAAVLLGSVVDPRFCPSYSIKVAMFSAYRKLDEGLSELCSDRRPGESVTAVAVKGLRWTGSKRSLIELIYVLRKYINNGQVSIKEVVQGFQNLLNTDLTNYPRIFYEVQGRKKGETLFLNQLINDMNDVTDENEKDRLRKRGFK